MSSLSKADLCLFLQQLQANPTDICCWSPALRFSLLRGGLLDLAIYGRRVASAPRFAFMAISSHVLAYIAKQPDATVINFTCSVPVVQQFQSNSKVDSPPMREKMSAGQIKYHEAALSSIAKWLTSLCTFKPSSLEGATLPVNICIRFICVHVLDMPQYVDHLAKKFISQAGKLALDSKAVHERVRSCRGEDDELLVGLASKLLEKKTNRQIGAAQLDSFLQLKGNDMLKNMVDKLETEMGFRTRGKGAELEALAQTNKAVSDTGKTRTVEKIDGDSMDVDAVGLDAEGWQILPSSMDEGSPAKKLKLGDKEMSKRREVIELD